MSQSVATFLVTVISIYAAVGAVFAVLFVAVGVKRIDPAAKEGTIGFRLLIIPGTIVLWPLLAGRWLRGVSAPPEERNAHRRGAAARAVAPGDDR